MSGWTYFVHCPEAGRVKIGQTHGRPRNRVGSFKTGCPFPLVFMGALVGVHHEDRWHRRYEHLRAHGEWFEATPELLYAINTAITEAYMAPLLRGFAKRLVEAQPDPWQEWVYVKREVSDALARIGASAWAPGFLERLAVNV